MTNINDSITRKTRQIYTAQIFLICSTKLLASESFSAISTLWNLAYDVLTGALLIVNLGNIIWFRNNSLIIDPFWCSSVPGIKYQGWMLCSMYLEAQSRLRKLLKSCDAQCADSDKLLL